MSIFTTQQTTIIVQHHLSAIVQGNLDLILSDYSDNAVLFTHGESYRDPTAIRGFFAGMLASLPADWMANFQMIRQDVEGEVAYLFWQAPPLFPVATDTFVVHNGKIIAQTFAMLSAPSSDSPQA